MNEDKFKEMIIRLNDIIHKIESKFEEAKICMTEFEKNVKDFIEITKDNKEIKEKECDHEWSRLSYDIKDDSISHRCIKCNLVVKEDMYKTLGDRYGGGTRKEIKEECKHEFKQLPGSFDDLDLQIFECTKCKLRISRDKPPASQAEDTNMI